MLIEVACQHRDGEEGCQDQRHVSSLRESVVCQVRRGDLNNEGIREGCELGSVLTINIQLDLTPVCCRHRKSLNQQHLENCLILL